MYIYHIYLYDLWIFMINQTDEWISINCHIGMLNDDYRCIDLWEVTWRCRVRGHVTCVSGSCDHVSGSCDPIRRIMRESLEGFLQDIIQYVWIIIDGRFHFHLVRRARGLRGGEHLDRAALFKLIHQLWLCDDTLSQLSLRRVWCHGATRWTQ